MKRLSTHETEMLFGFIQKASPFDKPTFTKIRREMALQIEKTEQKQKNKTKKGKVKEDQLFVNPEKTIEMHLFGVTFSQSEKDRSVIDQAFREYDDKRGYWKTIDDDQMRKIIQDNADRSYKLVGKNSERRFQGKTSFVDTTLKYAATALYEPNASSRIHLRSFRNGTVNLKTGQLEPHNKTNYLTAHIPYDYDESKTGCPEPFLRYIESSMGLEALPSIRAGISMVLDPTAPNKFLHVVGPSGSGKGVLAYLISQMFAPESVNTDNSFRKLGDPDQRHQYLQGCSLFVIDDITDYVGPEIASFYTLVERTAISGRSLFSSKAYNTVFNTRYVVCSTGFIPAKSSTSKGWNRRVFPLPTRAVSGPENPNLRLELKECIADVISWALSMDKVERNAIIANPAEYSDGAARYLSESDLSSNSVRAFIDSCLRPVEPKNECFPSSAEVGNLYDHYRAYCLAMGIKWMGQNNFVHQMAESIPAHFIPRHRATRNELEFIENKRMMVPSKWLYLSIEDQAFSTKQNSDAFGDRSEVILCKPGMKEGNLELFESWAGKYQFAYPYTKSNGQSWIGRVVTAESVPIQNQSPEALDGKGIQKSGSSEPDGSVTFFKSEENFYDGHVLENKEPSNPGNEPKTHNNENVFTGSENCFDPSDPSKPSTSNPVIPTEAAGADLADPSVTPADLPDPSLEDAEAAKKLSKDLPPLPPGHVDF